MSQINAKPGTGGGGGDGVELGGPQTGFSNGQIQFIAQDGTQGGDDLFTFLDTTKEFNVYSNPSGTAGGSLHTTALVAEIGWKDLAAELEGKLHFDSAGNTLTWEADTHDDITTQLVQNQNIFGLGASGTAMAWNDQNTGRTALSGTVDATAIGFYPGTVLSAAFGGGDGSAIQALTYDTNNSEFVILSTAGNGDVDTFMKLDSSRANFGYRDTSVGATAGMAGSIDGVTNIFKLDTASDEWQTNLYNGEFIFYNKTTGDEYLSINSNGGGRWFLGDAFSSNPINLIMRGNDSSAKIFGYKVVAYPDPINWNSIGVNDINFSNPQAYTGPNGNTYTVTFTDYDVQVVTYTLNGGSPDFADGDVISDGIAVTGTAFNGSGGGTLYLRGVTGGSFNGSTPINNGMGASGTTTSATALADWFAWTDTEGNSGTNVSTLNAATLSFDLEIFFYTPTGHTVNPDPEILDWEMSVGYGNMLSLDGLAGLFVLGDKDDVGQGTKIAINDPDQAITFDFGGDFYTFPTGDGTAGYVLTTDGSGQLSWQAGGGGGGSITAGEIGYGDPSNLLTSDANFTWDATTQFFKVLSGSSLVFGVDAANMQIAGGDTGLVGNGTRFFVSDAVQVIDFAAPNGQVRFGDIDNSGNGTKGIIDDASGDIAFLTDGSFNIANAGAINDFFVVDIASGMYRLGDLGSSLNGSSFTVSDTSQEIFAKVDGQFYVQDTGGAQLLLINTTSGVSYLGDVTGAFDSTLLTVDATAGEISLTNRLSTDVQYEVPTTGGTVVADGKPNLVLNPAGALLALTVTFPASPSDGLQFSVASTQPITTLTLNGGTILGTITTISTNGYAGWVYSSGAAAWVRSN